MEGRACCWPEGGDCLVPAHLSLFVSATRKQRAEFPIETQGPLCSRGVRLPFVLRQPLLVCRRPHPTPSLTAHVPPKAHRRFLPSAWSLVRTPRDSAFAREVVTWWGGSSLVWGPPGIDQAVPSLPGLGGQGPGACGSQGQGLMAEQAPGRSPLVPAGGARCLLVLQLHLQPLWGQGPVCLASVGHLPGFAGQPGFGHDSCGRCQAGCGQCGPEQMTVGPAGELGIQAAVPGDRTVLPHGRLSGIR